MNSQDAQGRIASMIAPKKTAIQRNNARKIAKEAGIYALETAIVNIKKRRRDNPKEWEPGYSSAITGIEILIQKIETGELTL